MNERHTIQKDIIYAALCEMKNHPTADMVYEKVHGTSPTISKATVYRVLGRMAERGTILRIPVTDGADHYDHQTHAHYHVHCDVCGKVDDVDMPALGDLCAAVTDRCGYELADYTVLFHGRCGECQM
ncbi:MAG: transcriptional repressor [Eubacteriales bacterium]|nr:transcriptional repressor [Eubacteriales bacterium]